MSWCCAREKHLKKRVLPAVYLKKPISQPKHATKFTQEPLTLGSVRPIEEDGLNKISHKKNRDEGEIVQKDNDFRVVSEEQGPTNRFVLKKILKCGYDMQEMEEKFKGTNEKWVDPDFNYEDITIGGKKVEWKRPEQFLKEPGLFDEEIGPNDVIQGWLNNCYFLSAVSCLTQKPHRVYSIFTSKQYNPNGYYICKLTFNGIYQEVIVDDLFPVIQKNVLVYAKAVRNKYIWVMVLEKCWAKLLKGYTKTDFGYTSEAFYTLTGAPTKFYILSNILSPKDPDNLKIFQRLKTADQQQYVTEVSIGQHSLEQKKTYDDKYGLMTSHAYSLLGVFETKLTNGKTVKLLQIRNPLSRWESKLMWNDRDPQWSLVLPSEKERMQFAFDSQTSDGVFYMDWQTFVGKFNYLFSICQINDQAHYLYTELEVLQAEVRYIEVETNGDPEYLGLSFVQEMQEHFQKGDVQYANISVMASKVEETEQGKSYVFYGAGNYYSQIVQNYFFFPNKKFPKGKYLFRIFTTWPSKTKKSTKLVVGLYSSAVIGLREVKGVDQQQFLELNCLSHAKNSQYRYNVYSDYQSWHCSEVLPGTNMGFYALSFGSKSTVKNYEVVFNESTNDKLFFMFEFEEKKNFTLQCQRGYQYIVLFALVMDANSIYRKVYFPEEIVRQRLPRPQINMS